MGTQWRPKEAYASNISGFVNLKEGTSVYSGARAFTIYDNDQITRTTLWNDVVVAYKNGGALHVRDIGQAVAGPQDTTQAGWADGKRAVFLVIYKLPGANVIDAVQEIYAELPRIKASMPLSLDISVVSDRTTTIRASVNDVQNTLFITIAPVVAVIFVFLRSLWATLIPSVTAPLALLGAFALMSSTTLSPCWRTSSVTSKTA
jgi:HAE1 family hydrophobic/amphiphilic exporter-1